MDSMQDLVTDVLQDLLEAESKNPQTTEEIFNNPGSNGEILQHGRRAEAALKGERDREEVRRIVAPLAVRYQRASYYKSGRSAGKGMILLFQLLDYLENGEGLPEIIEGIETLNNCIELYERLRTDSLKLDLLEEIWPEEAPEVVSAVTDTSLATVRKWFAGSNPSSNNSNTLSNLVSCVYQLRVECGQSDQEIREIFAEAQDDFDGKTATEAFQESRYAWLMPSAITKMLASRGSRLASK